MEQYRLWSKTREWEWVAGSWLVELAQQPEYAAVFPTTRRYWLFLAIDAILAHKDTVVLVHDGDTTQHMQRRKSFVVAQKLADGSVVVFWVHTDGWARGNGQASTLLEAVTKGAFGVLSASPSVIQLTCMQRLAPGPWLANPFPFWSYIPWGKDIAPASKKGSAARRRMMKAFVYAGYAMQVIALCFFAGACADADLSSGPPTLAECAGRWAGDDCVEGARECGDFTAVWAGPEVELHAYDDYAITIRVEGTRCVDEYRPTGRGAIPVGHGGSK